MLMAGLDGIQNKIDPGQPLDKDIYDLAPEELAKVPKMPGSLDEALDDLEADHEFLLKGDVFTEDVIETWIDYKRTNEVDALRLRPHPVRVLPVLRHLKYHSNQVSTTDRDLEQGPGFLYPPLKKVMRALA